MGRGKDFSRAAMHSRKKRTGVVVANKTKRLVTKLKPQLTRYEKRDAETLTSRRKFTVMKTVATTTVHGCCFGYVSMVFTFLLDYNKRSCCRQNNN